jgi:hypothetical protein
VAPRGYDAEAIAYEVIGEMLQGKSRMVAGWTRERLVKELERMISGKVRALNSLWACFEKTESKTRSLG